MFLVVILFVLVLPTCQQARIKHNIVSLYSYPIEKSDTVFRR